MDLLLQRYRNVAVLLAVIVAQLMLLAYQVKSNGEVRLIRIWAVSAVTPLARAIEAGRSSSAHFLRDYFVLLNVREENKRMKADLDRVQMENQYLRTELSTADRAKSLAIFQQTSPSKTIAAHVIGNTTGMGAKVVIVDRGTASGVEKGMAVITPDGIVGKVTSAFPTAAYVLLITDQTFAAGVISQKSRVRGTLKGQGNSTVIVDYVQNEQKLEPGEWFYTSGDDRIYPKGLPAGQAVVVRQGRARKEIFVTPSGLQNGLEEVLIVVNGVHAEVPEAPLASQPVHMQDPPAAETNTDASPAQAGPQATDADKLLDRYRKIGAVEGRTYGEGGGGGPNFNITLPAEPPSAEKPDEAKEQRAGQQPKPAPQARPAR
ncbi:MAG: rod shape-determining protein MreC [Bryobacteraceae bacterium]